MSEQNSSEANVKNGEKSGITIGNVLSPGIGDAFRSIKKSFIPDRKMMSNIVDMKNRLLSSDPEIVLDTESSDPRQRFLDGMEQFGLSEEDLKKKCEQSALMFNIMAIVLAVIVAIIIIEFPGYHAFGSFMIFAMPAFFLIFMLLLVIAKWGFYNWCIRNMKMGKFTQWLASPREWLPSSTLRVAQVMTLIAILAGSFANPGSASAASVDMSSSSSCQSSSSGVMATFTLPCDTDVYKNLLEDMFPSVTPLGEPTIIGSVDRPYTNSNGTSALANAFQAFLSVLMSVAMAMLSWHILVTLVSVAHEGTMLSQRWSVIWAPLRLFLGAGSLAPFVKGYCMAQVLILYVALWGGSMANVMWTAYVQGLTNPMISPSAIPYLTPSLIQIAQQRVCYAALKRAEYVIGGDNYIADIPTSIVEQSAQDEGTSVTDPAAQDHWMITNMVSGFLTGKKTPGSNTAQSNVAGATVHTKRYTWYYGAACGSTTVKVPEGGSLTSFGEKEHDAIANYISTIGVAADRLAAMEITPEGGAQDTTEAKAELRKDIASAYGKAVGDFSDAVNQLSETLNTVGTTDYIQNFKNDASKYGWATAGIYYMNISRMQGMADALIALNPITNNTGTPSDANNDVAKEVKMITQGAPADALSDMATEIANTYQPTGKISMSQVNSELSAAKSAGNISGVTVNLNTIVNDNSDNPVVNAAEKISQWAGSLVSSLANLTGSGATSNASENGESEIQALTEFGNNMITLAYMAIMAIFVGKVAGSLFSVLYKARKFIKMGMILTGIGEAATGVGAGVGAAQIALATIGDVFGSLIEKAGALAASWIVSILTFLLTVGVVHAYILPMMPFIHFTLFVLSMLIFVVEAMIAAPLWAFVHIKLNGQELIDGEQKMGYQLAFNLFLRAPLGMLGFFLSFAIFDAMMYFLRLTFYPAAVASTSNSTGLIGTCVMIAMMSYLHFTLAMRSFSLISEIPDRVSRWFGGPSVGSEHGHAEGAKSFMAGMVARGIANQAGGAMSAKKQPGGGGGGGQAGGGKTISRSRTQLGKGLDHLPSKSQSVSAERASSMRSASGSMAEGIMGDLEQGGMNISSSQHLREGLESAIHDVATGIEKQSLGNGDSIMDSLRNTINDHSSTQNMSRGDKEKIVQSLNTKLRQNIGHLAQ